MPMSKLSVNQSGYCSTVVETVSETRVGPGCTRRDLPANAGVRIWVVDIAPGAEWPRIDHHDEHGEEIFVVSGELIEGDRRYGPGQHLSYAPYSSHRPRSEIGVRLFGFNLLDRGE